MTSTIIIIIVSSLFIIPLTFLLWVHIKNFSSGMTTSERFGKAANNTESA